MGKYIFDLVEESKRTRQVYPASNSTLISLILKQDHSNVPAGFKPIALYNVIYKIMSTIMVNCLKPILPTLIYPKKTGFFKGRQSLMVFS